MGYQKTILDDIKEYIDCYLRLPRKLRKLISKNFPKDYDVFFSVEDSSIRGCTTSIIAAPAQCEHEPNSESRRVNKWIKEKVMPDKIQVTFLGVNSKKLSHGSTLNKVIDGKTIFYDTFIYLQKTASIERVYYNDQGDYYYNTDDSSIRYTLSINMPVRRFGKTKQFSYSLHEPPDGARWVLSRFRPKNFIRSLGGT